MKTLYLECNMGAAGDMLTAALWELLDPVQQQNFLDTMNHLGIPGVEFQAERVQKSGIYGTHMKVLVHGEEEHSHDIPMLSSHHHDHDHEDGHHHDHDHEGGHHHDHDHEGGHHHDHDHGDGHHHDHDHEDGHHHDHDHGDGHHHDHDHGDNHHHDHDHHHSHHHWDMAGITALISSLSVSEQVKTHALEVYRLIGEAEAHAHGMPVEQIHFHEVGSFDAVADVVGCCYLMEQLNVSKICASPVHVGSGFVRCAHGTLPVPAPATAYLLQGIPSYSGKIRGELCTPTGAALLRHYCSSFGDMPVMSTERIGYGMGQKEFEVLNCVRAFYGEQEDLGDTVCELTCNLDDMTPEALGFACEVLMNACALDVFVTPIYMKKNRPAQMLTCICREENRQQLVQLMLKHTTTLGVREKRFSRNILKSHWETVETSFGSVRMKISEGSGVRKAKPEYEDVKALALQADASLQEVEEEVRRVWSNGSGRD